MHTTTLVSFALSLAAFVSANVQGDLAAVEKAFYNADVSLAAALFFAYI